MVIERFGSISNPFLAYKLVLSAKAHLFLMVIERFGSISNSLGVGYLGSASSSLSW